MIKKSLTLSIIAASGFAAIPQKVTLVTSPDALISQSILRSQTLNEMQYKLKLKNYLSKEKEEELKYKELGLKEYNLQLQKQKILLEEEKLLKDNYELQFEIAKLKQRIKFLQEYPYTTLKFTPNKMDLIVNILKAQIEKEKLKKILYLKHINEKNFHTLKTQYDILKKFEVYFNEMYYNFLNNNITQTEKYYKKIQILSKELLSTNILYIQNKFSEFSVEITKLGTYLNELKAAMEEGNLETIKQKKMEFNEEYQKVINLYYQIRNDVLQKIISLQQTIGVFKMQTFVKTPSMKSSAIVKTKKSTKNANQNAKKIERPHKISKISDVEKERIEKQLSIEMGIPVKYLTYLTKKDLANISFLNTEIAFYKQLLNKIESNPKAFKSVKNILGCKCENKNELQNNLINKIANLIKEKFLIVDKAVRKYKQELLKREMQLKKLKQLEEEKQKLLAKKRAYEMEQKRKREEELRKLREERLAKLKKEEELKKWQEEFYSTVRKYKFLGIVNNDFILTTPKGQTIYLKTGDKISHYKVVKLDTNSGIVVFKDEKHNKIYKYNFFNNIQRAPSKSQSININF